MATIVTPKKPSGPVLPADLKPGFELIQGQFPKVGDKIALMWGTVGLQDYLTKIIFDERGGRQGFPKPVISALMQLHEYHDTLIPKLDSKDTWENTK